MTEQCRGEQVCGSDGHCVESHAVREPAATRSVGSRPDIPVRRYGTVPPFPEENESVWEIEAEERAEPLRLAVATAPRTIAEYGGTAVLLAALSAAALAGCVLYLH